MTMSSAIPRHCGNSIHWVRNGQIRCREDILDGLEQAPGSIAGLYRGENLGKCLIRIAPDVPG